MNGNNYILDYTNNKNGKIISFIRDIDNENFYKNHYINLADHEKKVNPEEILDVLTKVERFTYSNDLYDTVLASYIDVLKLVE